MWLNNKHNSDSKSVDAKYNNIDKETNKDVEKENNIDKHTVKVTAMTLNNSSTSNPTAVSRIAAGMSISSGEITSSHDIRFDGNFNGKISSRARIIIGETAVLSGDILCENIDIYGKFDGTVSAKDTISLKNGCVVTGSLASSNVVVELGSKLTGSVKYTTEAEFAKNCEDNAFLKQQNSAPAPAPAPVAAPVQRPEVKKEGEE